MRTPASHRGASNRLQKPPRPHRSSRGELATYHSMRDFDATPEPRGRIERARPSGLRYVIQKHAARRLHYDFRLELNGVLKSWAIPRGPSLDPGQKRLAAHTEDHPLDYGDFEGVIPEGHYGAGTVLLWDQGTWTPIGDPDEGYRNGRLRFRLQGKKLHGVWNLVRMRNRGKNPDKEDWLLIKSRDEEARDEEAADITELRPESVLSQRMLEDLAAPSADEIWRGEKRRGEAARADLEDGNERAALVRRARTIGTPGRTSRRVSALREDVAGKADGEAAAEVAGIAISHPDRVLYAHAGVTKLELAKYYESVAEWLLPHLKDRPLTLVRCPQGHGKQCFYQKHLAERAHPALDRLDIEEGGGVRKPYAVANSISAVLALVQMGVLELHTWGSRSGMLERPDRLILDLDPDMGLPWTRVVEAAKLTRALLDELGLESFLKTTGGKGLHIAVPLQRTHTWQEVKDFSSALARHLAREVPERFTANMSKQRREGLVFIDYLRNARGATAIAAYSTRAKPDAPVSVPIAWEELSNELRSDHFTLRTVGQRLRRLKADPWKDYFRKKQSLTKAMRGSLRSAEK